MLLTTLLTFGLFPFLICNDDKQPQWGYLELSWSYVCTGDHDWGKKIGDTGIKYVILSALGYVCARPNDQKLDGNYQPLIKEMHTFYYLFYLLRCLTAINLNV